MRLLLIPLLIAVITIIVALLIAVPPHAAPELLVWQDVQRIEAN
jgi:hypothetical protein